MPRDAIASRTADVIFLPVWKNLPQTIKKYRKQSQTTGDLTEIFYNHEQFESNYHPRNGCVSPIHGSDHLGPPFTVTLLCDFFRLSVLTRLIFTMIQDIFHSLQLIDLIQCCNFRRFIVQACWRGFRGDMVLFFSKVFRAVFQLVPHDAERCQNRVYKKYSRIKSYIMLAI